MPTEIGDRSRQLTAEMRSTKPTVRVVYAQVIVNDHSEADGCCDGSCLITPGAQIIITQQGHDYSWRGSMAALAGSSRSIAHGLPHSHMRRHVLDAHTPATSSGAQSWTTQRQIGRRSGANPASESGCVRRSSPSRKCLCTGRNSRVLRFSVSVLRSICKGHAAVGRAELHRHRKGSDRVQTPAAQHSSVRRGRGGCG